MKHDLFRAFAVSWVLLFAIGCDDQQPADRAIGEPTTAANDSATTVERFKPTAGSVPWVMPNNLVGARTVMLSAIDFDRLTPDLVEHSLEAHLTDLRARAPKQAAKAEFMNRHILDEYQQTYGMFNDEPGRGVLFCYNLPPPGEIESQKTLLARQVSATAPHKLREDLYGYWPHEHKAKQVMLHTTAGVWRTPDQKVVIAETTAENNMVERLNALPLADLRVVCNFPEEFRRMVAETSPEIPQDLRVPPLLLSRLKGLDVAITFYPEQETAMVLHYVSLSDAVRVESAAQQAYFNAYFYLTIFSEHVRCGDSSSPVPGFTVKRTGATVRITYPGPLFKRPVDALILWSAIHIKAQEIVDTTLLTRADRLASMKKLLEASYIYSELHSGMLPKTLGELGRFNASPRYQIRPHHVINWAVGSKDVPGNLNEQSLVEWINKHSDYVYRPGGSLSQRQNTILIYERPTLQFDDGIYMAYAKWNSVELVPWPRAIGLLEAMGENIPADIMARYGSSESGSTAE